MEWKVITYQEAELKLWETEKLKFSKEILQCFCIEFIQFIFVPNISLLFFAWSSV